MRLLTQRPQGFQFRQEPQILRTSRRLLGTDEPCQRQDPDTIVVQLDLFRLCLDGFVALKSCDLPQQVEVAKVRCEGKIQTSPEGRRIEYKGEVGWAPRRRGCKGRSAALSRW
jgi:hypothetical protein